MEMYFECLIHSIGFCYAVIELTLNSFREDFHKEIEIRIKTVNCNACYFHPIV